MGYGAVAVLWMIKLFLIYTLMVVIMPYILLRPILRGKAVSLQFLVCVVVGNFYYVNIVLFLGLVHITSGTVYLIAFLLPFFVKIIWMRRQIKEAYVIPFLKMAMGVVHGETSMKVCLYQFCGWLKKTIKSLLIPIRRVLRRNILEGILFVICMAFLVMYFAPYFYEHYGYRSSDMIVHQQWINAMDDGVLFFDGIYPMGMHAIIYYIHAVFGIHTYILMYFFPFVSDIYIFVILLIALKSVCRFRYLPYLGFFYLVGTDYIRPAMLSRYMSALPQEFGMMFYLPCLIAAIQFFRARKQEDKEYRKLKEANLLYTVIGQKHSWKESTLWLWVLIISFGLTFAVHFYITILAGILMVAVAVGYVCYVFRPGYLKKLVPAAILSLAIPLMPMMIAFMGGTPLQGSLYWATSVMGIDLNRAVTGASSLENKEDTADASDTLTYLEENRSGDESEEKMQDLTWTERTKNMFKKIPESIHNFYVGGHFILKNDMTYKIFLISFVLLLVQIPLMFWLKEQEYSRILIIIAVNHILLTLVGVSEKLGVPILIDADRMASFQAYMMPLCIALTVDSFILLGSKLLKKKQLWQGVAFVLTISFIGTSVMAGNIRKDAPSKSSIQTDGAAICLAEILNDYPKHKWTVISCNEERNMMAGSGWHYEVIDFLQSMEHYDADDVMEIPTPYVFFFIEKESLNYIRGEWDDSVDPTVSEEWASRELPVKSGLEQYSGTNRIILNSKMYYWMQEYKKRYPNDIKVFYEDDEFICYFMEQNEYYLHNFAIDYGYNER